MQNSELQTYEAKAILKDGRTATVTVEAEDKADAKYLLHHCGFTVTLAGISHDVERYDYRTVKKAA
jgi:type II secretory pathway component PulF